MAEKPKMAKKSKRAEKPKTAIENFPAQIQKLRKHLSFKVLCRLSHVVNILFWAKMEVPLEKILKEWEEKLATLPNWPQIQECLLSSDFSAGIPKEIEVSWISFKSLG